MFKGYRGSTFLRKKKIAGRIFALCILFFLNISMEMYICNYFHLHFTKEGNEEQYLSHLHIIQSLAIGPSLDFLTTVQPVIIHQERWFSFQTSTNKSLELAGWGANTGLKMWAEIQDHRNSIMLCFSESFLLVQDAKRNEIQERVLQ